MKAGTYRADLLLPGDRLGWGTVLDCTGYSSEHVQLTVETNEGKVTVILVPRGEPITTIGANQ